MVSVNLESIPSRGKHSERQILLVIFINLMDSLSLEIFCEADFGSQKIKLTSLWYFRFSEVSLLSQGKQTNK